MHGKCESLVCPKESILRFSCEAPTILATADTINLPMTVLRSSVQPWYKRMKVRRRIVCLNCLKHGVDACSSFAWRVLHLTEGP